ncbi:MAG: fumarate reductase/succinate dehydrogenase flavoprotein subunit, partial [Acidobacteria bacterium]
AGEAAAGLHGANRLGGNSLSDLLVFGRRAGLAAAAHAKQVGTPNIADAQVDEATREMLEPFERGNGDSPYDVHRDLQETMQNYVGIFRSEEDLKQGLSEIQGLKERAAKVHVDGSRLFNPGWHLARDLKSLLTVSEAVALSALERKESRGAHSRIDFPQYDEQWSKLNNLISRDGEAMRLSHASITEMPDELKHIVEAKA